MTPAAKRVISTLILLQHHGKSSTCSARRRGILVRCSSSSSAAMKITTMTSPVMMMMMMMLPQQPTVFCDEQRDDTNNSKPLEQQQQQKQQLAKAITKKPFWDELAKTTGNTLQEGLDTGIPANLSYSFVCGFCSGYALKKVGRTAAFVFGLGFVTLQTLSYYGYIQVDHARIQKDLESSLMLGKDRAKDRSLAIDKAFRILQYQLPAGVGFGTGFVGGIRSG